MKKLLFTLACAAMVCACDARHNAKANNSETTTAAANEEDDAMMAPDFTLNDIYDMPLTLSSFRERMWCSTSGAHGAHGASKASPR